MFGFTFATLTSLAIIAFIALYFPSVYIRKSNAMIQLLEKIEANTRK